MSLTVKSCAPRQPRYQYKHECCVNCLISMNVINRWLADDAKSKKQITHEIVMGCAWNGRLIIHSFSPLSQSTTHDRNVCGMVPIYAGSDFYALFIYIYISFGIYRNEARCIWKMIINVSRRTDKPVFVCSWLFLHAQEQHHCDW